MPLESALFEKAVANAFIGSEQNPAILPDQRQPSLIRGSTGKMNEVAFEAYSRAVQDLKNRSGVAEVFVEV